MCENPTKKVSKKAIACFIGFSFIGTLLGGTACYQKVVVVSDAINLAQITLIVYSIFLAGFITFGLFWENKIDDVGKGVIAGLGVGMAVITIFSLLSPC